MCILYRKYILYRASMNQHKKVYVIQAMSSKKQVLQASGALVIDREIMFQMKSLQHRFRY